MNLIGRTHDKTDLKQCGFSLVEVLISAAVLGVTVVALGTSMNSAFAVARLNTENLRATQILTEKMDLVRAYSWSQLTNSASASPTSFTAPFFGTNAPGASNWVYQGTITIGNAPVAESYGTNLRLVQVSVSWTSTGPPHSRSMSTLVSRYGIQTYSY